MELGIAGRTAVVTGGSKGIGRACVEALRAEGADVVAVSRDVSALDDLVADAAGHVIAAACDLTTIEGCDKAVRTALDTFGRIDILVNCAGSAGMGNVLDIDAAQIDSALTLKLHGYLRMAQRVAPIMKERGWGRIVNVAGSAGTSPTAHNLPTSLANITVHNVTRALSDELAPHGVQVNLVAPGLTVTDRALALFADAAAKQGRTPEDLVAEAGAGLPVGRAADPREVARVVTFLASDACSYVQASALYMDGGARRATP